MRNYFPKRPSGAPLHTLSKLYDVPVGFVPPPPLFWGWILLILRSPKGGCCSISDDLSCFCYGQPLYKLISKGNRYSCSISIKCCPNPELPTIRNGLNDCVGINLTYLFFPHTFLTVVALPSLRTVALIWPIVVNACSIVLAWHKCAFIHI